MSVADSVWFDARDCMTRDVVTFAVATSGAGKLSAMLKLAAADVPIAVDELDTNPWLLNCPNGTLDLRNGELRQHRREDYLTKLCPTNFNPSSLSDSWDRFLGSIFGDSETVAFVRRYRGILFDRRHNRTGSRGLLGRRQQRKEYVSDCVSGRSLAGLFNGGTVWTSDDQKKRHTSNRIGGFVWNAVCRFAGN